MRLRHAKRSLVLAGAVAPVALTLAALPGQATLQQSSGDVPHGVRIDRGQNSSAREDDGDEGEGQEVLARDQQYAAVRTAPAATVSSDAFRAARAQAAKLPLAKGTWNELTHQRYNSDALNYRDPFWSNSSGGAGDVSGRMTGIATDGSLVYAAAADGGVWRSADKGSHWTPVFDKQSTLSIGAIAVNPVDHSVWVGTGEANTAFENYAGDGIYRSMDRGRTWQLVGNRLQNSLVSQITFDGRGYVLVATSQGLLRRSTIDQTGPWALVLKPDPNPTHSPYRGSFFTDVKVRPGTHGSTVLAALGWRGGTLPEDVAYNGFYVSTAGGVTGSWHRIGARGIPQAQIGRTTFSWSADGSNLFAVVEDPTDVALGGVYRSASGDPHGQWTLVADAEKLAKSGSAYALSGFEPGGQAWYDQYVQVDPKDAAHVYLGLEEVFETSDNGATWSTIGPYWNFPLACWSVDPTKDTCPDTTHPDQHAVAIADDGTAYFGNDGGMYRRPAALRKVVRWTNLNAQLHTLQYYYAGIGRSGAGDAFWGGLQDNGVSLLLPRKNEMVSPFGGDGGDVIVDPNNANRAVNEYVYLNMALTTNGGRSDGSTRAYRTISPACGSVESPPKVCDPNPRFIAPFEADPRNINHWVAGGQMVWDNRGKGWNTVCDTTSCDWKPVHDLGDAAQSTSIGVAGSTIYAGWCGNGCNPGGALPFISGIDTNAGGKWHRVSAPNLPNRIPTALTVDPADPNHVYATYGAFSRRWIPGGGVGHVFESRNGGRTWQDLSGNLPDAPTNDLVIWKGRLVVGTDVGVFSTSRYQPGRWFRFGTGLPNASTNDLVVSPRDDYVLAATHGRGLWTVGR